MLIKEVFASNTANLANSIETTFTLHILALIKAAAMTWHNLAYAFRRNVSKSVGGT